MSGVGIERIRVYPSTLALDMRALVLARGGDVRETVEQMLIDERSVNPPWEDPVTMAVNAAEDLLSDGDRARVKLLLVGTESGLDQEKALSTWVHRHLGLPDDCRNLEIKHACYAGTGAVNLACAWLMAQEDEEAQALVLTTDESRQHFHRPYEFVMGAGAVALLLSRRPRFLELELGLSGVYAHEVADLIRPTSRVEAGHSETSLLSYLDAVDITFERYAEAVARARGERIDSMEAWKAWSPHLVYHAPFGGITARAHKAVCRALGVGARDALDDFEARVKPSLAFNRRMGGTYAGSVFVSLLGVASGAARLAGQRVGIYSYGSGSCAEYYSGVFGPEAVDEARAADLAGKLSARRPVSVREYEEAERARTAFIDCGDYRTPRDGLRGWYDEAYAGRGRLTFHGVHEWVRDYRRS